MSNILTAALLVAVASQFFKDHPGLPEVFVTEDGQPFVLENRASIHADANGFTYKRYLRGFDQEDENQETEKEIETVIITGNETDGLEENKDLVEGAKETNQPGTVEEVYESVASVVARIPGMTAEELKEALDAENGKELPRVTLTKALTEAIEKFENPAN